jgi:CheY-like chemotaxis protein
MNPRTCERPDERPSAAGDQVPVLIVDDDPVIRDALRMWLEDDGYTVWQAADGIDALAILEQTPSAVVMVTDYAMPRLDGRGVLDSVVANPDLAARTAFIYITSGVRILSAVFAGELLARGVPLLRKPFDLAALTRAVEEAQARLRRRSRSTLPPAGRRSRDPNGGSGCE